jgi:phosphodiesterase/alkaline phosphatase D-like protein
MILDDHEIIDGFGNNAREDEQRFLGPALDAYDEYVSSRQPQPPPADPLEPHARHKGYSFEYGDAGFFVLDTRTKRSVDKGLLIQREQEEELLRWIEGKPPYRDYALRFVVSSVPFVAETRPPSGDDRNPYSKQDKWSGDPWRGQRARIIRAIHEHLSGGLVFLVGDMHCSYHATMQIGDPEKRTTIHELAGGPINQLRFARRSDFFDQYHGECDGNEESKENERAPLPWTSTMQAFHGAAASVLRVGVDPEALEVTWEVVRLSVPKDESARPRPLSGLIRFQGCIEELGW